MSCDLNCNYIDSEFDLILTNETKITTSLNEICRSNIGWYSDKSLVDESYLSEWGLKNSFGVYLLWHKADYCDIHNLFSMRCLYVGKGFVTQRINDHFKIKDFSEEMLVYFTFYECTNREAKYLEQLILDNYNIPHNKSENKGKKKLIVSFTQSEVD